MEHICPNVYVPFHLAEPGMFAQCNTVFDYKYETNSDSPYRGKVEGRNTPGVFPVGPAFVRKQKTGMKRRKGKREEKEGWWTTNKYTVPIGRGVDRGGAVAATTPFCKFYQLNLCIIEFSSVDSLIILSSLYTDHLWNFEIPAYVPAPSLRMPGYSRNHAQNYQITKMPVCSKHKFSSLYECG